MQGSRHIEIVNITKNAVVGKRIRVADKAFVRLVGLLGTKAWNPDAGSSSSHHPGSTPLACRFPSTWSPWMRRCVCWEPGRGWALGGLRQLTGGLARSWSCRRERFGQPG